MPQILSYSTCVHTPLVQKLCSHPIESFDFGISFVLNPSVNFITHSKSMWCMYELNRLRDLGTQFRSLIHRIFLKSYNMNVESETTFRYMMTFSCWHSHKMARRDSMTQTLSCHLATTRANTRLVITCQKLYHGSTRRCDGWGWLLTLTFIRRSWLLPHY